MTRLCLVVALPCEARPWIEHYRLSPLTNRPFRIYRNEQVALVVGGVGALACATATAYLAGSIDVVRSCVWLNVGIAGHPSLELGTTVLVTKSIDQRDARVYYPSLPIKAKSRLASCITVDEVETRFGQDTLYDMECSGFFFSAIRFGFMELVHAVKVVSDNTSESPADLDRAAITGLLSRNLSFITENVIDPMLVVSAQLAVDYNQTDVSVFLRAWHFTVSNEVRLRTLVADWQAIHDGAMPDIKVFRDCRSATGVLSQMRLLLDANAV